MTGRNMLARQSEVGRIMVEEDAEEADTSILTWAAATDHTVQGDELTTVRLHGVQQPRPIAGSVISRQVANEAAVDADLDRIRVMGVVRIQDEDRVNVEAHMVRLSPPYDAPQPPLPVRLAHPPQRLVAREKNRGRDWPGARLAL